METKLVATGEPGTMYTVWEVTALDSSQALGRVLGNRGRRPDTVGSQMGKTARMLGTFFFGGSQKAENESDFGCAPLV